jgi:hypothetical protein
VGLIIRYGGSLDGTEIVAIILDKKSGFSVGEIVMFFNVFILGSAGLVFGWDKAMYSLAAYFVAYKVIDITIEGLDETKGVMIVSDCADEIANTSLPGWQRSNDTARSGRIHPGTEKSAVLGRHQAGNRQTQSNHRRNRFQRIRDHSGRPRSNRRQNQEKSHPLTTAPPPREAFFHRPPPGSFVAGSGTPEEFGPRFSRLCCRLGFATRLRRRPRTA